MDEHRIGLQPILRKVWAPVGERPIAVVQPRYEWLYLAGFVHPQSGRTTWWLLPRIDKEIFQKVLVAFAQEQGVGARKKILLVLDGAGWHALGAEDVPEGLELIFQPPYSPEVQPAEHLWELSDEALVNRWFRTIDEMWDALGERCRVLAEQTTRVLHRTLFAWWPLSPSGSTV